MRNTLILLLALPVGFSNAQSKKEIKQYDLKALTETVTLTIDGKEVTLNDSYQKFDKHGNLLEEIKYDKAGRVKERIICKFNGFDNKTEEITYDAANQQIGRETYRYDELGEKSEEWKYDGKNALVSRSLYKRDRRGLKTEKKTYDSQGKLIQTKKYHYDD